MLAKIVLIFIEVWNDIEARGELIKNIGLGVFVNALYGISDGSVEIFNLMDVIIGVNVMLLGIKIERSAKWDN